MRLFVRDKKLYTSFFSLLLIISLQNLISLGVSLVDNVMLGVYNEYAMSGAAIANQFQFMLQMIVAGIAGGISVLGAQYWGKREIEPIRKIIGVGMKFALLAGVIFFVISFFFPRQALLLLTNDENVIAEGVKYMRIMSVTNIIFAVSNTLVMSLRSVETAFIGTVMAAVTMVVKIIFNYLLIYGNFGLPELGIDGAAISTLIGWSMELVIILVYMRFIDKKIKATLRDIFSFDTTYLRDYLKTALPVILSGSVWGIAQAAQTAILGHMSGEAIAANSISAVVYQVTAVLSLCAASAAAIVIGKTVGEGKIDKIKPYTITLQVLFILIGLFSGAVLFLVKDAIIDIYAVSEEARRLAVDFMIVLSITVVGTSYEYPVAGGIIQGGGDTKFAFIVDLIFLYGFALPLAALSAFVFNLPPVWTFFLLKSDQLVKCIPNAIKCNRYKWVRQLTRSD
jgi:putative MATE family efflux protein